MDFQSILQQEAQDRSLVMASLSSVGISTVSKKIPCCGGAVEKIVAESSHDCTVLLRDMSGTMHCAIHGSVTSQYPDILAAGALILLRDVTVLVLPTLMPPILVVCLEHLAALLLPEGPPGSGGLYGLVGRIAEEETATSTADCFMEKGMSASGACADFRDEGGYLISNVCAGHTASLPDVAVSPSSGVESVPTGLADASFDDENCLQLADDL
ncbi:putative protein of unknown function (DUF4539) [Trypanosoma vivax]|uniref:Homologous recombination OB-fold protein OB-fold domain-containing protein n=1 Tax=Trypanosoma vivax (strain Y486) TaxID=1055687 RepID=G0UC46_TRYVY|nr:putative protein of unknown function (DUF4539) [Trypanosoma vivax]CCC53394.1 conserved hypothetical protein [Trypanosoma vivax Y486]